MAHHFSVFFWLTRLKSRFIIRAKGVRRVFYVDIHLQKDIIFGFYVCRMACKQGRVNRIDRNMRIRGVGIVRLHDMKCFEFAGHVSTMDERRGYRLIS